MGAGVGAGVGAGTGVGVGAAEVSVGVASGSGGSRPRPHLERSTPAAITRAMRLSPDALYMDLTGKSLDDLPTDAEAPVPDA